MATANSTLKRVTLELGDNSASIICPDVDVKAVALQVAMGAFYNSGQVCIAAKRIFIHRDIYGEFLEALSEVIKSWKVGPATSNEQIMLGPVQNRIQFHIVKGFFEDSKLNGHKFIVEGTLPDGENGYVIQPAVLDRPLDDSKIGSHKLSNTFSLGPILPILCWSDEDEVIGRVNNTSTGLGGAVWSADLKRAERLAYRIEAGTVWINHFERPLPQGFFSGHKESGIGGEWGEHGLLSYMKAQCIHMYKSPVEPKSNSQGSKSIEG
ncbi:hypothetical protein FE257_006245 [Aspergillus nanangensis]|uniref:aldehyde dehydrogenase (NAD(+)) n=1 Tax=Aspergillus nanangensis TaxID=2582783 RepID=A0AAD4GTY9_ASPNN|nr:hypothetical protein FE257_006245 [Aspergillus nanangensis]